MIKVFFSLNLFITMNLVFIEKESCELYTLYMKVAYGILLKLFKKKLKLKLRRKKIRFKHFS